MEMDTRIRRRKGEVEERARENLPWLFYILAREQGPVGVGSEKSTLDTSGSEVSSVALSLPVKTGRCFESEFFICNKRRFIAYGNERKF